MTRKWIGQTAVRLYPPETRTRQGDEVVGTLLDASDASLGAFLAQLVSLIIAAVLVRSREAVSQTPGRTISDTLRCGAVITVASSMTTVVVEYVHWGGGIGWATLTSWQQCLAPTLILAMFIFGQDRAAGITGLTWCLDVSIRQPQLALSGWIGLMVLPILGFGLMTVTRPRRQPQHGRALVLIPILSWACFRWTELGQHSGVGYLVPVLATVILLPIKPSLTLGTALACSFLAAFYITIPGAHFMIVSLAMISCTPIAVVLTALTRRALTRP